MVTRLVILVTEASHFGDEASHFGDKFEFTAKELHMLKALLQPIPQFPPWVPPSLPGIGRCLRITFVITAFTMPDSNKRLALMSINGLFNFGDASHFGDEASHFGDEASHFGNSKLVY